MNIGKSMVSNPADALRAPAARPGAVQATSGDDATSSFGAQLARAGGNATAGSTPESAAPPQVPSSPVAPANAKAAPAEPTSAKLALATCAKPSVDETAAALPDDASAAHGLTRALDAAAFQVRGAGGKRVDSTASTIARQKIASASLVSKSQAANAKDKPADAAAAQSAATTGTPSSVAKGTSAGAMDAQDATNGAVPGANPDPNSSTFALAASLPQIAAMTIPSALHPGAAAPAPALDGSPTDATARISGSSEPDVPGPGRDLPSQDGSQPLPATLDPAKALAAVAAERSGIASPRVAGAPIPAARDAALSQFPVPTQTSAAASQALAASGAAAANAIANAVPAAPGKSADAATPAGTLAASPENGSNFAQVAQLAGATGPGNAPGAPAALGQVASTPGTANFAPDLAQQLVSMVKTGAQSVRLSLTPAELGPVSVSIQMSGTAVAVAFSASHPATRAALQDALPQLSNLFSQSGLQLSGAMVGDGSQQQAQSGAWSRPERSAPEFGANPGRLSGTEEAQSAAAPARSAPGPQRLVDTFA